MAEHELGKLRAEIKAGFAGVNERFDRLHLALVAGLLVIVAAMAGVVLTTL
jgi:hypothetical protein